MSSWFYLEVVIGALLQLGFGYACVCCMLLWLVVFNTAVSMSLRPKRYVGFVIFTVDVLDLMLCWSLRFFSCGCAFVCFVLQDISWSCSLLWRLSDKKVL